MGSVFIFEQHTGSEGDLWMVRAGNHTIGTYATEAAANSVARALCGDQGLHNDFVAEEDAPAAPVVEKAKPKKKLLVAPVVEKAKK